MRSLIQEAYVAFANGAGRSFGNPEIKGAPGWVETDTYDIAAKADGNASFAQMAGPMLQTLLEERFKLKIHSDTQVGAVYFLTLAKGGPKLEKSKEGSCVPVDFSHLPPPAPGQPRPNFCGNQSLLRNGSLLSLSSQGATMEILAGGTLSRIVDRPIIDKTGLKGQFDLHLEFAPDSSLPMFGGRRGPGEGTAPIAPPAAAGPSIFEALLQVGLRLESGKASREVLVIDRVERPSEN